MNEKERKLQLMWEGKKNQWFVSQVEGKIEVVGGAADEKSGRQRSITHTIYSKIFEKNHSHDLIETR